MLVDVQQLAATRPGVVAVPLGARRMDVDESSDVRPALIVSLSLQAMWAAVWHWLAAGAGTPLVPVVERALRIAADGLLSAQIAQRGQRPSAKAQPRRRVARALPPTSHSRG